MTAVVEVLKAGKQLLIDKGWTQRAFARNAAGTGTFWDDSEATCFCAAGAVRLAALSSFSVGRAAIAALDRAYGYNLIEDFNDAPGRTKEEVLAIFDKAIAAEEAKQ